MMRNASNLPDDAFDCLSDSGKQAAIRYAKKRAPRKPVVEVDVDTMWNYEYQAKSVGGKLVILASNSLDKLKAEVRTRGWRMAWLSARTGSFSYNQNIVSEYPYVPR